LIEKYIYGIATPPNKEIHKTALGATETVTWEYNKMCLSNWQKKKLLQH
jgi:hypothetical protein